MLILCVSEQPVVYGLSHLSRWSDPSPQTFCSLTHSKLQEIKLKDQTCDMANCCCCEAENSKLFSFRSVHWSILVYAACVSHVQSPHVLHGILCPTWYEAQERPGTFGPRLYFPDACDSPFCACETVLILNLSFRVSESCTMEAKRI